MPKVAPTRPRKTQTPGEKPGKTQKPGEGPKTMPGKRKA